MKKNLFPSFNLALSIFALSFSIFVSAYTISNSRAEPAPKPLSSITLVSPNGKNTITLKAGNSISGVWISGNDSNDPQVSIYKSGEDGAVVGVYGDRHGRETKALDAALAANKGAATIQGVDAKNNPFIKPVSEVVK